MTSVIWMVGGQTAISDHLAIGARARIAGKSGVMRDVDVDGRAAAIRPYRCAMASPNGRAAAALRSQVQQN